jgi:hypothetical protein
VAAEAAVGVEVEVVEVGVVEVGVVGAVEALQQAARQPEAPRANQPEA